MEHKDEPHIKPSGNSVKIGMIGPFSGANTYKGELGTKGIEVAQQLIPYLDNGDSIEWIREDDHGIPEYSVSALKTLVETHKVAAIIILSGSDSVLAVAKVAEQYKTPILTLFASHPDITRYSSLVNQFNFDDTFQAAVAALYIRDELLIDEVAMLTQSGNAHFTYLANEFAKQFTATEGIITDRYELKEDEQNYLPILQSIKNKDPELLYLPIAMEHIFEVKSALIQLNWNPKIMLSDGILANIKVQKKYPVERMNGMMAIDAYSYDMEYSHLGKQLLEQMTSMEVDKLDIGTKSVLAMESYALLVDVLNRCIKQKNKPSCINDSIRSTTKFEGVKGLISFDSTGKVHRSLNINRIQDGVTEFIVRVY